MDDLADVEPLRSMWAAHFRWLTRHGERLPETVVDLYFSASVIVIRNKSFI